MNKKPPTRSTTGQVTGTDEARSSVDAFVRAVENTPKRTDGRRGRLLFAMDATASRQPTWDRAARLQGEMFRAAAALGGLEVQLAFFRGFGEFKVAPWTDQTARLLELMTTVDCRAGETQVNKVLSHAANETRKAQVHALIYVGDSFEEDVDRAGKLAGELGLLGVPAFMFHEGDDPIAAFAFREVARLSGGAYCPFDASSADALRTLLGAVAVYAAGGRAALENHARDTGGAALRITDQMYGKRGGGA
ncbi:MAG: VWA domain-containing protein [Rhodospirillales bacterium]